LRSVTYADKSTTRYRSYEELELTWFDALSPKYDYRYSEDEVEAWFAAAGLTGLEFYKHKVGICGTKAGKDLGER
jgi:hypothetical protein